MIVTVVTLSICKVYFLARIISWKFHFYFFKNNNKKSEYVYNIQRSKINNVTEIPTLSREIKRRIWIYWEEM